MQLFPPQVRKRRLEARYGELCVSQLFAPLFKFRASLKTVQFNLQKSIGLLEIKETPPEKFSREVMASSELLGKYLHLLEQKLIELRGLGYDVTACHTKCVKLMKTNGHLQERLHEQGLQEMGPFLYQAFYRALSRHNLEAHFIDLKEQLNTSACRSPFCPPNCGRVLRCKKPKVSSDVSYKGPVLGESSWAHGTKNIEERIKHLEQEVERQGEKVENLEKENEMLKSRVSELQLLPRTPLAVEGNEECCFKR